MGSGEVLGGQEECREGGRDVYHSRGLLESRARRRAGNTGTYKQGAKAITQSGLLLVGSRFTEQGSYLGVVV